MPATIRICPTDAERAGLEERFEATRDAETRLRYQMVLLAAAGRAASQIAPIVRRSVDTVQRVLRRYRDEGAAGVPHRPRPGRPAEVPAAWQEELCRVIEEDPPTVGVTSANWTTRLLAAYLFWRAARNGDRPPRLPDLNWGGLPQAANAFTVAVEIDGDRAGFRFLLVGAALESRLGRFLRGPHQRQTESGSVSLDSPGPG